MCGRYAVTLPPEAMARLFAVRGPVPNFPARWNLAPTEDAPVVRLAAGGAREIVCLRWGLVPHWAKAIGNPPLINARAETAAEKPAFRDAFARRRALVPADAFYEWAARGKGAKQPFAITRADGAPFAMAALWERFAPKDGPAVESFAILTTDANAPLAAIHHRMPVILPEAAWETWLSPATPRAALQALMRPAPDGLMSARPVSRAVNAVVNDHAGLLDPAEEAPVEPAPARTAPPAAPAQGSLF